MKVSGYKNYESAKMKKKQMIKKFVISCVITVVLKVKSPNMICISTFNTWSDYFSVELTPSAHTSCRMVANTECIPDLDKQSLMIILESLLTTFDAAGAVAKICLSPKPNYHSWVNQFKLVKIRETHLILLIKLKEFGNMVV